MFDIGITKLMIVGGIALIVIGPERLPRVARMVGTLVGRAQRYVADVKAEVNRSIELEDLQKMRSEFESAARDVHSTVQRSIDDIDRGVSGIAGVFDAALMTEGVASQRMGVLSGAPAFYPVYKPPRKKWRLKRGALPHWYKRREGVRAHVQSGAARVARFRPASRIG